MSNWGVIDLELSEMWSFVAFHGPECEIISKEYIFRSYMVIRVRFLNLFVLVLMLYLLDAHQKTPLSVEVKCRKLDSCGVGFLIFGCARCRQKTWKKIELRTQKVAEQF